MVCGCRCWNGSPEQEAPVSGALTRPTAPDYRDEQVWIAPRSPQVADEPTRAVMTRRHGRCHERSRSLATGVRVPVGSRGACATRSHGGGRTDPVAGAGSALATSLLRLVRRRSASARSCRATHHRAGDPVARDRRNYRMGCSSLARSCLLRRHRSRRAERGAGSAPHGRSRSSARLRSGADQQGAVRAVGVRSPAWCSGSITAACPVRRDSSPGVPAYWCRSCRHDLCCAALHTVRVRGIHRHPSCLDRDPTCQGRGRTHAGRQRVAAGDGDAHGLGS
ncbi:MAG: hypothetical protein JWQ32_3403 [Marmoricola sp.]|nr:hypothetical protein [Marmoricola sp.]